MTIVFETNMGDIELELDHDNTPVTAKTFLDLVESGYYNGSIFHRVIADFMIQGGGFESGMVAKDKQAAIDNEAAHAKSNQYGTIAMARTSDPHSASAQFFINVKDNPFLDFQSETTEGWGYCVFGHVISGMDVVMKISEVPVGSQSGYANVPVDDIVVTRAYARSEAAVER